MLFNSFEFLLFFPAVAVLYFLLPKQNWRNCFLLAASYYFYMCWKAEYALLLLTSTAVTHGAALAMARWRERRKALLWSGIAVNFGILFFFKYYAFAAENLTALLDLCGVRMQLPEWNVLLPVGISFYVFQALGYLIDVYRGDVAPVRDFFRYALFVSFFPQLVAGPIERSHNLLPQFEHKHTFDGSKAISGVNLMLWGYFLKLVIADRCAIYVDTVFNDLSAHNGGSALLASVLFCFQLYGDFAGYSYIAIGCSRVMGFSLMDNFRRPYFFSASVQEFWKRNHISLTTWFMDYVYYPMIGTSCNIYWWCFCIFFTFFLSGFWHGAAWTYVMSFSLFGLYLVVCLLKDKRQRKFEKRHNLKQKAWWLWANRACTFFLVMFALIFFRAGSLADAIICIQKMFGDFSMPFFNLSAILSLLLLVVLFVVEYAIENKKIAVRPDNFLRIHIASSAALAASIFAVGVLDGGKFIYFQF